MMLLRYVTHRQYRWRFGRGCKGRFAGAVITFFENMLVGLTEPPGPRPVPGRLESVLALERFIPPTTFGVSKIDLAYLYSYKILMKLVLNRSSS